jgi:DNA-directed RNA polymerase specialized sigma24 family protein
MLRPEQRDLYKRIVIEGESPEKIAAELGVGRTAIVNRMTRIKENIKKML